MKRSILVLGFLFSTGASAAPSTTYDLWKSVPLGAPDRWDYVVYDDQTNKVLVAHGDRLAIVDARSGTLTGEVKGITGGTHGAAVSVATGQGFTDDGRAGKAIAYDLRNLKITHSIAADVDADAIALDQLTGHLFVIEGDPAAITVIDPKTDAPIATIKAGEKLEYAVADKGSVYVAGNGAGDVLKIDARSNKIVARWPAPGCTSPHGIAFDSKAHRLFMGCINNIMMVVDAVTGRTVARLPIGSGSDAIAFDQGRRRVFSSNGLDGTISVYQERSPDHYSELPLIRTLVSARTMAADSKTGRLFVAGAETEPAATPKGRPVVKPGTFRLMIFQPHG